MSDKVNQNKENQGANFDQFKVNPEEVKEIKGAVFFLENTFFCYKNTFL
jgi:hypothetical protein